ncbi:MAG TPA: hypothetical protein VI363_04210 [Burkholderiales bacterium]
MTVPRSFSVFATAFAVTYAVVYSIAVWKNYALFTYHPATNEFGMGVEKPKDGGLAMYWYGWIATAGIAASVVSLGACYLPQRLTSRLWAGLSWAVPLAALIFFAWLLRGYFLR